ncbi:MAG: hypothetical protein V4760_09410 [Bdellovibrionota bacterium]
MKFKIKALLIITGLTLACALAVFGFGLGFDGEGEAEMQLDNPFELASTPIEYEKMNACDKQDLLWRNVKATQYKSLPEFKKFGLFELIEMGMQAVGTKGSHQSDFAPKKWKKLLHARGAIAKVKIVSRGTGMTGIFRGADCGLLRLSLTFKPEGDRKVAPGLALKVLRDRTPSANVSALVSLSGQKEDYNFFRNPLSNIVPIGESFGEKRVHDIFSKASRYPEELMVTDMAAIDSRGDRAAGLVTPRQLFFVPGPGLNASTSAHDVRSDFLKIPAGTVIYRVMAASSNRGGYDYSKYTAREAALFLSEAQHVADIVTTSEFVASKFGDDGIFFRHQLRK